MPGGFQQDPMSTTGLAKSTNVLRNPQIGINVSNNAGMAPPKPNLTPAGGGPLPATSQGVQVAAQGIYPPGQGPVTSQVGRQGPVQPSVLTPQPGQVDQVGAMPQEPYFGNFGMTRMAYEIGKAAAAIDRPGRLLDPVSNTIGRAGVLVGGIPADILAGGFPTGGTDAWRSPQSNREDHERSLEMMNAEYPEELEDTKVRLGAPDMVDDLLWKREAPGEDLPWYKQLGGRVLQNRKTSPVGKLLGYPGTAVADVFQSLTRLPGYNSASDVVHNPWKNTSMTELGLGRAAAMQQLSGSGRKDKGYLSRLPRKALHDLAMIASNVPVFGSAEMNALAADRVHKAHARSMPAGESAADKETRRVDQATYRKHQAKKDKEKKDKEKKEAAVMPQEPYFGNFGMTRMAYEIGKAAAAIDRPGRLLDPVSNTIGRAGILAGLIPAGGTDAWRSPQSNRGDHERSLAMMNAEYPEELEDTKVRLGAPDMVDDLLWKRESPGEDLPWYKQLGGRVLQNRKTSPAGKLIGYPGTAVLDVLQSILRQPGYNPASDVVHNPWKNTAMTELGLGRAATMQQLSGSGRKDKGYLSRLPRKALHDLVMLASGVPVAGPVTMNMLSTDKSHKALLNQASEEEYMSRMPDRRRVVATLQLPQVAGLLGPGALVGSQMAGRLAPAGDGEGPADKVIHRTDQATYRKHQEKKDKEEKKEAAVMLRALGRVGVSEQLLRKLAMTAAHKWQKAPDQRGADVDLSDVSRKTKIDSKVGPGGSSAGLFAPKMAANMRTVSPVSRVVKNNSPSQSKWSEGHKYQGSSSRKVS